MRNKVFSLSILLFLLLVIVGCAGNPVVPPINNDDGGASTFYVSPNGKDSNPGTVAKPWKTLTKAAETARAGDTVYIMSGTYKERLVPKNSGEDGRPIRFYAAPNNEVIIDGTDNPVLEESHCNQFSGYRDFH
jgi:hypothetical protein